LEPSNRRFGAHRTEDRFEAGNVCVFGHVIGRAIQALRPHLEVTVVEPDELQAEVARLEPALVISSQPKPATSEGGPAWVDHRPYDEPSASVCIGGRCARLYEPGLDDLLSVVDEAARLSRTPSRIRLMTGSPTIAILRASSGSTAMGLSISMSDRGRVPR